MQIWPSIPESILSLLPFLGTLIAVGAALWGAYWLLLGRHPDLGNERKFPHQIIMLALALIGLLAIILVLPITEGSRNQLIGLIGILISGILAFSSTTIVANLMAGVLLRMTRPFRIGDFIRVGDHSGRVSERGLFDTEIQTEMRELIALPNSYLISNPVTTIRSSGTIISVSLSLGYDLHHSQIESLLLQAAEESELEQPFVHIVELGDFAVSYRVHGLLSDSKRLLTARSTLCQCVLDVLHSNNVEIVSPAFMNQRRWADDKKAIPGQVQAAASEQPASAAEDIVFDKAERAEQIEIQKQELTQEIETLEAALKEASKEDKEQIQQDIELNRERLKALEQTEADSEAKDNTAAPFTSQGRSKTS